MAESSRIQESNPYLFILIAELNGLNRPLKTEKSKAKSYAGVPPVNPVYSCYDSQGKMPRERAQYNIINVLV